MDSVVNILTSGENWRLLAMLVAIYCFYVLTKSQMKDMGYSINKQISELKADMSQLRGDMSSQIIELRGDMDCQISELRADMNCQISELRADMNCQISELRADMSQLRGDMDAKIDGLKYNDFAHLSSAFEALTYVLEKNRLLSNEDKEYVVSRLAHS